MNGEEIEALIAAGDAFLVTPREIAVQAVILGAVVGASVGFIAYRQGQRHTAAKYEEIIEQEIAQAKAFYAKLNKEGMETPAKAKETLHPEENVEDPELEEAVQALTKYQGHPPADEDEPQVEIIMNDHSDADEDWDYDREFAIRAENPDKPYVIHLEEWMENEFGFDQVVLTYYVGDSTLADERDEAIPYSDPIIGDHNLSRFGDGSGDVNTILIRNERLSTDFEVSLAEGKYAHQVLGLEHSDGGSRARQRRNELRKFRDDPR